MDIVITGRHTEVSERFRRQAEEKLAKVTQWAPKAHRVDVELSHERNPRQSATRKKVEITVRNKGPVIRAEASAEESYAALDMALGKLTERLRRSSDRRKVHHGRQTPPSVRQAQAEDTVAAAELGAITPSSGIPLITPLNDAVPAQGTTVEDDESPIVIRSKDHIASPMTLDQALYEMELVGHDFYLFVDAESGRPSVVYRRHGWSYGVIRLQVAQPVEEPAPATARAVVG